MNNDKKPKKDKDPVPQGGDSLVIYGEGVPLTGLPETGEFGAWYLFNGEYWYFSSEDQQWRSGGGDRPTKPPTNP